MIENSEQEIKNNHEEAASQDSQEELKEEIPLPTSPYSSPSQSQKEDNPLPTSHSSPSQSLRDRKSPSPPLESPSNSVASDGSSQIHELPSFEDKPTSTPPENLPAQLPNPAPVVANRSFRTEPALVIKEDIEAKVEQVEENNVVGREVGGGGGVRGRRLTANLSMKRGQKRSKMVLLGFRICGFVFCLISLSVMATDKNQGWALDSFYRYKEFRYCMAVNVIGFVYSGLQVFDLVYYFTSGKHMIRHHFRHYLYFSMDQIMAYLLLSGSSSAATRVDDWQSNWGKDKFPDMARASVVLSIIAFLAFAFSSLISGHTLVNPP